MISLKYVHVEFTVYLCKTSLTVTRTTLANSQRISQMMILLMQH